ncbi:MAG: PQQ-binding-like beta-propeller repeat protein [Planctomycetota bacterium]
MSVSLQRFRPALGTLLLLTLVALPAAAQDWPRWGRTHHNNMAAPGAKELPASFKIGDFVGNTDDIELEQCANVRWIAKLGSQSYGNPTVAGGRVFVGSNNDQPRDEKFTGDRSLVYCFDEKTGEYLWQFNVPKLGAGKVSDWEFLGICSSPTVEGDRVYLVTNLCEVVCLDVNGFADGNDGMKEEAAYYGGRGNEPIQPGDKDADIIWVFDMIGECGVSPHNVTSSSVMVLGDQVWATTSNGVDYGHVDMPNPYAPSLIVLDKETGKLIGEEFSGLGERTFHCTWSSPSAMTVGKKDLVVYGGPDGFIYGFDTQPVFNEDEELNVLKEVWRCDANLPSYRTKDGEPIKYGTRNGPNEFIASPVVFDGKVYGIIGQDPEHGEGVGNLVCVDPTKKGEDGKVEVRKGDITDSGVVWQYSDIHRSISTPSIVDGLVYVADYSGFVYCLDAKTGKLYWKYDTFGHIWGSTLVADGKVYIGNEDGFITILAAGKEMKKLAEIDMKAPVYSSPIVANGVLYIATQTHLFAVEKGAGTPSRVN